MEIHEKMRFYRRKKPVLSLGRMAQICGVSQPYLSRVELGKQAVTMPVLDVYLRMIIPDELHAEIKSQWFAERHARKSQTIVVTAGNCYVVPEGWSSAECVEWVESLAKNPHAVIAGPVKEPQWLSIVLGG